MKKSLTIIDDKSQGVLTLINNKKKDLFITARISLDNYGFEVRIWKEDLKQLNPNLTEEK